MLPLPARPRSCVGRPRLLREGLGAPQGHLQADPGAGHPAMGTLLGQGHPDESMSLDPGAKSQIQTSEALSEEMQKPGMGRDIATCPCGAWLLSFPFSHKKHTSRNSFLSFADKTLFLKFL